MNWKILFLLFPFCFNFSCQLKNSNTTSPSETVFTKLNEKEQRLAENAIIGMQLKDSLMATVFVAEPQLINPTNIDIDAYGRVWAIETLNYRNDVNPKNPYRKEGDRILVFEDTDHDGKADTTIVFYQGEEINAALGICVLANQVIISVSPNVFVFTDENNDLVADKKELLFSNTGGENHDHGIHACVFGPDGKLYFNAGNIVTGLDDKTGRTLISRDSGDYTGGFVFRCNVDGSDIEIIADNFRNIFELAVDSYGNIWQTDNDDDGTQSCRVNYVVPFGNYGYVDEITKKKWRTYRVGMHKEQSKRHWHQNDPGVFPNIMETGSGAPSGLVFYEGHLLPPQFQQQMLNAEPGHQSLRVYPTKKLATSFIDLLKSEDQWCRPVDLAVSTDGSLFVADWYDSSMGGHYFDETQRGRIFRIAPKGTDYQITAPDFSTPEAAVAALKSPNNATRYLAWTSLASFGTAAESDLLSLWNSPSPIYKARSLWLLARLPNGKQYIQDALQDSISNIRITALRIARELDTLNLEQYIQQVIYDPVPEVLRTVAISLRYVSNKEKQAELWSKLALQYKIHDRWFLESLGIASDENPDLCFQKWIEKIGKNWNTPAAKDLIWRSRSPKALAFLEILIKDPKVTQPDLERYFRAFHFHNKVEKQKNILHLIELDQHPLIELIHKYALGELEEDVYLNASINLKSKIAKLVNNIKGEHEWIKAIKNLQLTSEEKNLLDVFMNNDDQSLAVEAAEVLISLQGSSLLENKLKTLSHRKAKNYILRLGWLRTGKDGAKILANILVNKNTKMSLKRLAVSSITQSYEGQLLVFDLFNNNQLPDELNHEVAQSLTTSWEESIRIAAKNYLNVKEGKEEEINIAHLVKMDGEISAGEIAFNAYCQSCHLVGQQGVDFGPDLSDIGTKLSKKGLYTSIVYPNNGINFGYEGFIIKLKDNSMFSGFIENESESELTLRMIGGISKHLNKENILSQEKMDNSLMPSLHSVMTEEELIDLVAFLKNQKQTSLTVN